jgi:predicted unusual protein kinase regulating ubiquinone biosynthesis (AarF/ABC1/UbiB family)
MSARLVRSLASVVYENRLFLHPGTMMLLRVLGELEGTAKQVNPSFGLWAVIQPSAEDAVRRRLAPRRVWLQVQRGARAWARLLDALPGDLNARALPASAGISTSLRRVSRESHVILCESRKNKWL